MKKSKLKKKIKELQQEIRRLEIEQEHTADSEEVWKYLIKKIIDILQNRYDVSMSIEIPEPETIESTALDDAEPIFVKGMTNFEPVLTFDFEEHDKKVLKDKGVIQ